MRSYVRCMKVGNKTRYLCKCENVKFHSPLLPECLRNLDTKLDTLNTMAVGLTTSHTAHQRKRLNICTVIGQAVMTR